MVQAEALYRCRAVRGKPQNTNRKIWQGSSGSCSSSRPHSLAGARLVSVLCKALRGFRFETALHQGRCRRALPAPCPTQSVTRAHSFTFRITSQPSGAGPRHACTRGRLPASKHFQRRGARAGGPCTAQQVSGPLGIHFPPPPATQPSSQPQPFRRRRHRPPCQCRACR